MNKFLKKKNIFKFLAITLVISLLVGISINKNLFTSKASESTTASVEENSDNNMEIFSDEDLGVYDSYVTFNSESNSYELKKEASAELSENVQIKINDRIKATNKFITDNNLTEEDLKGNITKAKKNVPQLTWYGVYWHISQKQLNKIKGWIAIGIGVSELAVKICAMLPEGTVTKAIAAAMKMVALILLAAETWLLICEQINNKKGVKVRFIFATKSVIILP